MSEFNHLIDQLSQQKYAICDNFFPEELYHALKTHVESAPAFQSAGVGRESTYQQNHSVRRDKIQWLEKETALPFEQAYLQTMKQLAQTINQELFMGLHELETHYATYEPGAFYAKHVDQFRNNSSRQLSVVYYLNDQWSAEDGGQLKLYDLEHENLAAILPLGNRFVCFTSDLPHEVLATLRRRCSLTGWFKR